jgi:hypothetical protein
MSDKEDQKANVIVDIAGRSSNKVTLPFEINPNEYLKIATKQDLDEVKSFLIKYIDEKFESLKTRDQK